MNDVIDTIICSFCQGVIAPIHESDKEGYLTYGPATLEAPTTMVVKLQSPQSRRYRFFCGRCGGVNNWTSDGRDFVEFTESPTLENIINASETPGAWQFGRVSIPPSVAVNKSRSLDEAIKNCAAAFASNLSLVNAIADGTLLAIGLSVTSKGARGHLDDLMQDELHQFSRDLGDVPDSPNAKEFAETIKTINQLKQPLSPELRNKMRRNGEVVLDAWANRHTELTLGVRTVLQAQLSLAWTAIEVLSEDLWIAAVNNRPSPLAVKFAGQSAERGQDKNIAFPKLAEFAHDFDLSNVMGSLFAATLRADFKSLKSTRGCYDKAFDTNVTALDSADLRLLELVRNLIVHRGGIVDQTFMTRLNETGLSTHRLVLGAARNNPLPINAEVVNQLVESAAKAGADLLQFVVSELWPA